MEEEKILKIECTLDRIFYPKYAKKVDSGEFAIFSAIVTKRLENCDEDLYSIKLKGNTCTLEYGTTYKVFCKLSESHEIYGDTYELVYISKCIDISSKDKQKEFLKNVLNENLVDKLFDEYDDVIKLLEERDVKSLICEIIFDKTILYFIIQLSLLKITKYDRIHIKHRKEMLL